MMSNEIERITIEVDSSKAVSELDRVEKKMNTALSGESAAKKASKTGKEITNTFSKAADKITKEFKDASTKAANSLDDLVDVADDIKDAFDDLDIEKTIGNGASKAADKIENEVGNALAVVKRELGEVNTTLTKMNTEGMVNSLKKVSAEFDVISKTLTSSLNSSMASIMPILSNTINSVGPALTNALSGVSAGLNGSKAHILPIIDIPESDFRVKDLPEIELEPSVKMDEVLELDSTVKAIPEKLDIDVNASDDSVQNVKRLIDTFPRQIPIECILDLKNNISQEVDNFDKSFKSIKDSFKNYSLEPSEDSGILNSIELEEATFSKIKEVTETLKNGVETITEEFDKKVMEANESLKDIGEGVNSLNSLEIKPDIDSINDVIDKIYTLEEMVKSAEEKFKTAFKDTSGIKQLNDDITTAVTDIRGKLGTLLKGYDLDTVLASFDRDNLDVPFMEDLDIPDNVQGDLFEISSALEEVKNGIHDISKLDTDSFDKLSNDAKKTVDQLSKVKEVLPIKEMREFDKLNLDGVKSDIQDTSSGIKEFSEIFSTIDQNEPDFNSLSRAASYFTEITNKGNSTLGFLEGLKAKLNEFNSTSAIGNLGVSISGDQNTELISKFTEDAKAKLLELSNDLDSISTEAGRELRENLFAIDSGAMGTEALSSIIDSLENDLNKAIREVGSKHNVVQELLSGSANQPVTLPPIELPPVDLNFEQVLRQIPGQFANLGSSINEVVAPAINGVADKIGSHLNKVTDVVKRSLVSVGSVINSTFPKIVPAVKSTFNVAKNSVITFGTVAKQKAIEAVNAFNTRFPSVAPTINATFNVAKNSVMAFSSKAVSTFNTLRQTINQVFTSIKTSPFLAKLNGIRKAVSNIIPSFSKLRAAIKKSLTDAGFNFDAARAKIDAFKANVSTIGEGFTKMKGFITGALSKVKDLVSGIRLGKSATDSMNKSTLALRNTFGSLTSLLAPYLSIFYVIRGIGKAITMGNEATETESLYKTVFEAAGAYKDLNGEVKEIYPEMNAWIKEQNTLLGLNTTSLQNNTAQVFKFAQTMGIANNEAAKMSRDIALLAEDMASFYNKDSGEIFDNLMSGLAGMTRAVSKYGMNIYETNIAENAARFGINATGRQLNQTEKMWVRYMLMMEQAGVAHGDLARTIKSPANQIRLLKSDFITLGTIVGQAMQPILVVVIPALRTLTSILTTAANKVKDFLTVLAGLLGINMDFGITGGIETPDAAADLMDETANVGDGGSGDLASGYDDAADSIGGAADAAKELNKELGSMDEINTLDFGRDKGGSGSGSGGSPGGSGGSGGPSGSGGGGDFSANYKVESDTSEDEDGPFSKAAVMFAEMFKQFQIGFNRYMPDLREAFEGFTESFGRCCESLSSFLSSVYRNGGRDFIQRMGEVTAATAIAALEIGGTILDSLAKLWDHLDPERNKATYLFILHMNNLAITVKNALLDIGDAFSDLMNNGGQDVLNQLGSTAMSCGSMMAQFAETVLESMRKVWEYINPANNESTQAFLNAITGLLSQVQVLFDNITNNLNGFSSSEGMTTIQRLAEVFVQIATAVTNTVGLIIEEITKLWGHLDPETNPYVSALASAFEDLLGKLTVLDSIMAGFLENGGSAFLQNMMDIGAIIGTIVVEAITWLLDNLHNIAPILQTISEVVKTIIEFIQENAGIIATVLGSFALLAGIGTVIGKVTPIISAAIKALKLFKGAWDLVTLAIDVVQIALGGLSAPVAAAIALIALVVAAVIDLWDESEAFRDAWEKVWDNIKTTLKTIWDSFIKPIIDSLVRTLLDIWNNGLKPLWEKFKYVVEQIGIFMADILNAVLPVVNKLIEWFGPIFASVFDTLCKNFGNAVIFICDVAGDILEGIGDVIAGVKKIFNGIITFITGVFTGNWKKAWQGVKDIFSGIFETLGGVLKAPINVAISAINACIRGLNKINIKVPDWVPGIGGKQYGINIPQIPKLAKGKRQSAFVKSRKNGGTLIQIISEVVQ